MKHARWILTPLVLLGLVTACGRQPTPTPGNPTAPRAQPTAAPTAKPQATPTAPASSHPGWTTFTSGNRVHALQVQGDLVWAGVTGGVVVWDTRSGTYVRLGPEQGLVGNVCTSIAEAADGALWFGTDGGGVSRLGTDGRWQSFTTQDGLADNSVNSIAVAPDGALWFGTYGGVSRLGTGGRWQSFTTQDGLANDYVESVAVAGDGALWFGTFGGVSRLGADGRWQTFSTQDGLANDEVRSMAVAGDGTLWFGTFGGVSRLGTDGRWQTFTTQDGLATNQVPSIAMARDGALWLGTGGGVSRLGTDGRWQTFTTQDGLANDSVRSIAVAPDGALWFGTYGGVSRYQPNVAESAQVEPTPPPILTVWETGGQLLALDLLSTDAALEREGQITQQATNLLLAATWVSGEQLYLVMAPMSGSDMDAIPDLRGAKVLHESLGPAIVHHPNRGTLSTTGGMMAVLSAVMPSGFLVDPDAMNAAAQVIANRLGDITEGESVVWRLGADRVMVVLSGESDPDFIMRTIAATGLVEFVDAGDRQLNKGDVVRTTFPDSEIPTTGVYQTIITGRHIREATVEAARSGFGMELSLELGPEGAQLFSDYASKSLGRHLTIVRDKQVFSSSVMDQGVVGDRFAIPIDATEEEAVGLNAQLKYGALPVPLRVAGARTIGPVKRVPIQ